MHDNNIRETAISLRIKEQMPLSQISKKLNISKSTASLWLKEYPLKDIELLREKNRKKGVESYSKIRRVLQETLLWPISLSV